MVAPLQVNVPLLHQLLGLQHVLVFALGGTVDIDFVTVLLAVVVCQWQLDSVGVAWFSLFFYYVVFYFLNVYCDGVDVVWTLAHEGFLQLGVTGHVGALSKSIW